MEAIPWTGEKQCRAKKRPPDIPEMFSPGKKTLGLISVRWHAEQTTAPHILFKEHSGGKSSPMSPF